MKLSIITINRNNAAGLEKTMKSVAAQTFKEFEYIIVDGASRDDSVEMIKRYQSEFTQLKWVSEPDSGIYNAMNKGIQMASGDYIQILNSGDCLAADDVTERMPPLPRTENTAPKAGYTLSKGLGRLLCELERFLSGPRTRAWIMTWA